MEELRDNLRALNDAQQVLSEELGELRGSLTRLTELVAKYLPDKALKETGNSE